MKEARNGRSRIVKDLKDWGNTVPWVGILDRSVFVSYYEVGSMESGWRKPCITTFVYGTIIRGQCKYVLNSAVLYALAVELWEAIEMHSLFARRDVDSTAR